MHLWESSAFPALKPRSFWFKSAFIPLLHLWFSLKPALSLTAAPLWLSPYTMTYLHCFLRLSPYLYSHSHFCLRLRNWHLHNGNVPVIGARLQQGENQLRAVLRAHVANMCMPFSCRSICISSCSTPRVSLRIYLSVLVPWCAVRSS